MEGIKPVYSRNIRVSGRIKPVYGRDQTSLWQEENQFMEGVKPVYCINKISLWLEENQFMQKTVYDRTKY